MKKPHIQGIIIPREAHPISRQHISQNALKVLYGLKDAGYEAYLVGGCVRDLILGLEPKDFDVATNAHPEQIRRIFRNCQLIGRRFRLAHVRFRNEIIEVATFRRSHDTQDSDHAHMEDGMIVRDNVYGTIEEDALRRDFTVNALYYNIRDFSIIDFTDGMHDLNHKIIRSIGETKQRFQEDPARLLRAIRFMSQLNFNLAADIEAAIPSCLPLLQKVSSARLFLEVIKAFHKGHAVANFENLKNYGILSILFPSLKNHPHTHQEFYFKAFTSTDERIAHDKPVTPGFLFAALLWPAVYELAREYKKNRSSYAAIDAASEHIIRPQVHLIAIPKRYTTMMREVWRMQYLLCKRGPSSITRLFLHPRFRAAFDLLWLRGHTTDDVKPEALWWEQFQIADEDERLQMIEHLKKQPK